MAASAPRLIIIIHLGIFTSCFGQKFDSLALCQLFNCLARDEDEEQQEERGGKRRRRSSTTWHIQLVLHLLFFSFSHSQLFVSSASLVFFFFMHNSKNAGLLFL